MKTIFSSLILGLLFGLEACEKAPKPYAITCLDGEIKYKQSDDWAPTFADREIILTTNDPGMIIRSNLEYRYYLVNPEPEIDFERNTLLVGRILSPYPATKINEEVFSDCASKTITYNITLLKDGPEGESTTYFHAIIPKIFKATKVKYNVIVKE